MSEDLVNRRTILGGAAALVAASTAGTAQAQRAGKSALGRRDGRWLNEPRVWSVDPAGDLSMITDKGTDFWRETHYGFTRDSGHFLGFTAPAALGQGGNRIVGWPCDAEQRPYGRQIRLGDRPL